MSHPPALIKKLAEFIRQHDTQSSPELINYMANFAAHRIFAKCEQAGIPTDEAIEAIGRWPKTTKTLRKVAREVLDRHSQGEIIDAGATIEIGRRHGLEPADTIVQLILHLVMKELGTSTPMGKSVAHDHCLHCQAEEHGFKQHELN